MSDFVDGANLLPLMPIIQGFGRQECEIFFAPNKQRKLPKGGGARALDKEETVTDLVVRSWETCNANPLGGQDYDANFICFQSFEAGEVREVFSGSTIPLSHSNKRVSSGPVCRQESQGTLILHNYLQYKIKKEITCQHRSE